jgi:hypothetical protein
VVGVSSSFSVFSFVSLFCCSAPAFPFYGIIFFIATPPFSRSIYGSSFGLRVVAQLVTRACLPEEMPLAAPSLAEKGEGYLMKCGTAGCCVEPIYELCGAGLHACFFYIWRDFFERNILILWIFFSIPDDVTFHAITLERKSLHFFSFHCSTVMRWQRCAAWILHGKSFSVGKVERPFSREWWYDILGRKLHWILHFWTGWLFPNPIETRYSSHRRTTFDIYGFEAIYFWSSFASRSDFDVINL